ncbi:MAG: hypothetical protein ABIH80_04145 [Methanobacteriota archaeon]
MSFLNCEYEILGTILKNECIIYHKTLLEQSGFFLEGMPVRTPELNIEYYLEDIEKTGGYVLVVEGALVEGPDDTGKYCLIGGETVKERIILKEHVITKPVVDLPECPPKPEHILALLALLLLDKLQFPEDSYMLDKYLRFKMIKGG